jgi:hypothetical protein
LIFSLLALAISLVAFHQAGNRRGLKAEIKNLQGKLADLKEETADRLEKVQKETGQALEKIGEAIKVDESE